MVRPGADNLHGGCFSDGRTYRVKVEYYESGGGATAKVSWSLASGTPAPSPSPSPSPSPTCGSVGSGAFVRLLLRQYRLYEPETHTNRSRHRFRLGPWLAGSQHWRGYFFCEVGGRLQLLSSGDYRFTATADDGIRVYVDGVLVINAWLDEPPTTYSSNVSITSGSHRVRVEYFEYGGGATAKVSWAYSRVLKTIAHLAGCGKTDEDAGFNCRGGL